VDNRKEKTDACTNQMIQCVGGHRLCFVMFCHLFNIQFHLQHWRVLSRAEMTGIRQQKKIKKIKLNIIKDLQKKKRRRKVSIN